MDNGANLAPPVVSVPAPATAQLNGGSFRAAAAKPGTALKSGTPRSLGGGAFMAGRAARVASQLGTPIGGQEKAEHERGDGELPDATDSNSVGNGVRFDERTSSLKLAVGGRLWVMGENRRGQCGVQAGKGRATGEDISMVPPLSQPSISLPRTTVLLQFSQKHYQSYWTWGSSVVLHVGRSNT